MDNYLLLLVPRAGIEPARDIVPRDFKSLASTNSATQARKNSQKLGGECVQSLNY